MHVIIDSSHSDSGRRVSSTCKADPFSSLSYPITQPFQTKDMLQVSGIKAIPYAMSGLQATRTRVSFKGAHAYTVISRPTRYKTLHFHPM